MPSTDAGQILLPIARASIASALGRPLAAADSAPWLADAGACFVTLTQQGELRGCIGTLQAHRPLLADVQANALAAAFHDPRFPALAVRELDVTSIEVSLLSPMEPLAFASEADVLAQLRPGIDGVVFEFGARRSTFLPQVWEQLPDADEFMAHLKRKAGLPASFWTVEVRLQRYTVSKWKESELQARAEPQAS
jgi:hypothetical protein